MTIQILEAFHRDKGYKLANLDPATVSTTVLRHVMGVDGNRKIWVFGEYAGGGTVLRLDHHGNVELEVLLSGWDIFCGEVDGNGNPWVGDGNGFEIRKLDPVTGATLNTLTLTESGTWIPMGMLYLPERGSDPPRLFVHGRSSTGENNLRLFTVDVATATQASVSGNVNTGGTALETIIMAYDPENNRIHGADRNLDGFGLRWGRTALDWIFWNFSPDRNLPLYGMHYAFGYLWTGAYATAAGTDSQITRFTLAGAVDATITISDGFAITGFANDDEYLYAVVTAHLSTGPVEDGKNRIIRIDPETPAIDSIISNFGGATRVVQPQDGDGDRPWDVVLVEEERRLPIPELVGAFLWLRGDDRRVERSGDLILRVPNFGPQGPFGNFFGDQVSAERVSAVPKFNGRYPIYFSQAAAHLDSSLAAGADALKPLHDGTGLTLTFVAVPELASVDQGLIDTIAGASNTRTGISVTYNGTDEFIRVRVGNGGATNFVVDFQTPNGTVPLNEATIVSFIWDPSATDPFSLRLVGLPPSEASIVATDPGTGEIPNTGASDGTLVFGLTEGTRYKGYLPELVAIGSVLLEYQQRSLEKYLQRRWQT